MTRPNHRFPRNAVQNRRPHATRAHRRPLDRPHRRPLGHLALATHARRRSPRGRLALRRTHTLSARPARMGVVRPVPQANRLDRIQPRRADSEATRLDSRRRRSHDRLARVPQRCALSLCLLATPLAHARDGTGGLLVDFGVLTLRTDVLAPEHVGDGSTIPRLPPSHPAVVEWRAMTVIELSVLVLCCSVNATDVRGAQGSHRRGPSQQVWS